MQFVNNYHVLHGRREYEDDAANGRVRWLKRLWLATETLTAEQQNAAIQSELLTIDPDGYTQPRSLSMPAIGV